ncbi:MAG: class I SAM-dependent methyltransferase [Chloroflexi bacterium]|nr:class I SAM-dependent methyltransferase [Chloroflexota bacterium]
MMLQLAASARSSKRSRIRHCLIRCFLEKMNLTFIYNILLPPFRRRRMWEFVRTFAPTPQTKVLDVGGTPYNWKFIASRPQITLLNLSLPQNVESESDNLDFVVGDGTDLKYADAEFDICYSNSVIEHLYSFENQRKFADEIRRVGRKIWVQTPARTFFFEPHFLTPFIHYLPKNIQRRLLRNFTVWGLISRPGKEKVDKVLSEIRLLSYEEMKILFPDCEIRKERFLGFTKAYVAVRQ